MVRTSLAAKGRAAPIVRLLVADDQEIVRWGLKALLSSQEGWIVCAEASSGREAVALAAQHKPDIVVMDVGMPVLNGFEATRRIREMLPNAQVLIFSDHYSDQLVREIVDAGARGYVLKSDTCRDVLRAVEALVDHRSFFTAGAAQIVIDECCNPPLPLVSRHAALIRKSLSAREREIVQLLTEGRSSKEVATVLGIRVKTVDTHRANIMYKLEIHSITDLVRYALRNNIIEI